MIYLRNMIRVLHLGKLCPPNEGGIEVFTFDLLEYLNRKGVKADLLCFGNHTGFKNIKGFDYCECKMNVKLNSAPLSLDFVKKFLEIEKNYDIIHVHSPNPLAEFLSLFSRKKIVVHWHSDIVRQKIIYKFYKPIQQMFLRKSNAIICTSPQYLETSNQIERFREKALVVPLGLNPEKLSMELHIDSKFEDFKKKIKGKKIILSVGRFVGYKGFEYLIKAGKYIKDENVVIAIIGDGPLFGKLKKLISSLGLENKILLLGRVDNVYPYMKISDVFCLPSITRNEAFGLVLVEALYFGKPLITTNVEGSGMSYVNQNGITGFVVPPKNPEALADAINTLLKNKELYEKFSKNARERFKEFEISNIGDKVINLYEEVIR